MKKIFKRSLSFLMSALLICSMAFSLQITPVIAEEAGTTDEVSFYENLSESDFTEDDTITVLIEFDYPENDYDIRETDSLESSQEQLRLLRASNRAYYTENNQDFIDDLDIEYSNMDVSAYSPYVFVTFDTWDEYADARDTLIELSEDSKVKRVFAEETPVMEDQAVNVNTSLSSTNVDMDDAKKMLGVKNANGSNVSNYTGQGIRVGVFEFADPSGLENIADEHIKGELYQIQSEFMDSWTHYIKHGEKVVSIIGGAYGIAPNVDFYFADQRYLTDSIEWLLTNEVNIINMSCGYSETGYYSGYDVYIDYISRDNLVLIVAAAGNYHENNTEKHIASPGLGLNVLTVGSVDAEKNISNFSCFLTENDFSQKPTFVAPGEKIIIPNTDNNIYTPGTSFSAPMITGMAALLMEEFPTLIYNLDLLSSALINGCEWLPTQNYMWEPYAGYGLVNYANTRSILSENRYSTAVVTETEAIDTVLLEVSTFLSVYDELTFCLFDLARQPFYGDYCNMIESNTFSSPYTPSFTMYKVKIFKPSGTLIRTFPLDGDVHNNIISYFFTNIYEDGIYNIKVYMDENGKQFGSTEYLSLTYSTTHEHTYTHRYSNPTRLGHTCHCACGASMTEPHIFHEIFGEARYCVKCGYTG